MLAPTPWTRGNAGVPIELSETKTRSGHPVIRTNFITEVTVADVQQYLPKVSPGGQYEAFGHLIVGNVTGTERGKVGEYDYTYPRVEATSIYLWPKRPLYVASPYYDPWLTGPGWGGYYGFGWGWGPYWGAPPIIIHERGGHHPPPPPPKR